MNSVTGLYVTMTSGYGSSSTYSKDLSIKLNQTYIYIKDKIVNINGEVRATLPFKNNQVTVKRETTAFIVVTGNHFIECLIPIEFRRF